MRWIGFLILGVAACGCAEESAEQDPTPQVTAWEDGPWETMQTRTGSTRVRWRAAEGTLPFNEYFDLLIELERTEDDAPISGAQVFVRCEMPAHKHGMNVEPRSKELGDGRYRVEGMLLHMTGDWVLGVDLVVDDLAESASFPFHLDL